MASANEAVNAVFRTHVLLFNRRLVTNKYMVISRRRQMIMPSGLVKRRGECFTKSFDVTVEAKDSLSLCDKDVLSFDT